MTTTFASKSKLTFLGNLLAVLVLAALTAGLAWGYYTLITSHGFFGYLACVGITAWISLIAFLHYVPDSTKILGDKLFYVFTEKSSRNL